MNSLSTALLTPITSAEGPTPSAGGSSKLLPSGGPATKQE